MTPEHRTLLTRAARAAGYDITWKEGHCKGGEFCGAFIGDRPWNPLDDDGDALRLAVELGMDLSLSTNECIATRGATIEVMEFRFDGLATRLAITRAAASMAGG